MHRNRALLVLQSLTARLARLDVPAPPACCTRHCCCQQPSKPHALAQQGMPCRRWMAHTTMLHAACRLAWRTHASLQRRCMCVCVWRVQVVGWPPPCVRPPARAWTADLPCARACMLCGACTGLHMRVRVRAVLGRAACWWCAYAMCTQKWAPGWDGGWVGVSCASTS